ncbi:hypothetical protein Droror1_Dr00020139 [Drosera rotundifolia]
MMCGFDFGWAEIRTWKVAMATTNGAARDELEQPLIAEGEAENHRLRLAEQLSKEEGLGKRVWVEVRKQ